MSAARKGQWTVEISPPPNSTAVGVLQALRIALRYQHRTPTVPELIEAYGMSRATAYRWIAAFKQAKGQAT